MSSHDLGQLCEATMTGNLKTDETGTMMWARACESGRWTHSKAQCSACVDNDAHSCCYNLWWQLVQATDKTSMTKHGFFFFFYCSISTQPPPSQRPHSRLWIFGSFGSVVSGRTSVFSTRVLLKTQVLADGAIWCFFISSKVLFQFQKNIHTPYDSLPFRTKPAQHSHANTLRVSMCLQK